MDFEIISQESYLGDPLPKLLKQFHSIHKVAASAANRKTFKWLLQNGWTDFEMISQECSLGVHLSKLLKLFQSAGQDGGKSLKQKNVKMT